MRPRLPLLRFPRLRPLLPVIVVLGCLLLVSLGAFEALSAVRAFVAGESVWSKDRADASAALHRYVDTGAPAEMAAFEAAVQAPLALHRLRLALEASQPAVAMAAAVEGGVHPSDAPALIYLYLLVRPTPLLRDATLAWKRGDALIDQMQALAYSRSMQQVRALPAEERRALHGEIDLLSDEAAIAARQFSDSIGVAARRTANAASAVTMVLAALLALGAGYWMRKAQRQDRAARAALDAAHERLSLATASDALAVFEWRLATDSFVLDVRGCELYGYRPQRAGQPITRRELNRRHHPDDRAATRRALDEAARSGQLFKHRFRLVVPDAPLRHLEITGMFTGSGTALRMTGIGRDVSEQELHRAAEASVAAALEASERRFRLMWETAPDAVLLMDEHSRIVYANEAVTTVFGHDPQAVVGQNISLLQPPALREGHRRGMARYLASGVRNINWRVTEARGLHRDGHEFPLDISFSHISDGGTHLFAGFLRDTSARVEAESQRRALEDRLRQAQRLEAVGTLAAGIAHDFNNVLAAILGNVRLAALELPSDHPASENLGNVKRAAQRARNLVTQILTFSRPQAAVLVGQALQPLVRSAVNLLRPTLPAGVTLALQLPDTPLGVAVDATQIEQVVINLCTNASHAVAAGGHISVGMRRVELTEPLALRSGSLAPGAHVHLWVRDDGKGMSPQTLGRIFEPFFTTKPVGQGTGLGLSVVHGIVTAHGGAVGVHSTPGQGTTFDIYLPWQAGDFDLAPVPDSGFGGLPALGRRVLYVDDDELVSTVVVQLFRQEGHQVHCASSAEQALALLGAQPTGFDLVVTDLNMPGMSGIELAAAVRRTGDLPVLVTSGHVTAELRATARAAGADGLIGKERLFEDLLPAVRALLAQPRES